MDAQLLTVGSELTAGATVNTNAAHLSRRLAELGIRCRRHVAVGDDSVQLIAAVQDALRQSDLVVLTGGLGPTFDDRTMEAIAAVVERPLVTDPAVVRQVRRFYRHRGRPLDEAALRQAVLPQGARPLPNPLGTAPGLWLALPPNQLLIALPGVPREMQAILEQSVLPRLSRWPGRPVIRTRTLRTAGVVELQIEAALKRLRIPESVEVGLYPHLRQVDIRLTSTARSATAAQRALGECERSLRRALGRAVYGVDRQTLEEIVGRLLVQRGWTLAAAESCTGGQLCDRLTDVSGSSRYVRGAVVAYHNDLKRHQLGVPTRALARFGAVSAPVARAMAEGVRRMAGADVGLSTTGIAGPTGARAGKPVGLVYLGLAGPMGAKTLRCQFLGDRASVKAQTVQVALNWLRLNLLRA
jgi:nicotinamide-nucleotide amidase